MNMSLNYIYKYSSINWNSIIERQEASVIYSTYFVESNRSLSFFTDQLWESAI